MYKIATDIVRNRVVIRLEGFFELAEMRRCVDETIAATKRLRNGYDVITDIEKLMPATADVAQEIGRAQSHFAATARRGVRVVGGAVVTGIQFKRTGANVRYQSVNVATLAEAEKMLATR